MRRRVANHVTVSVKRFYACKQLFVIPEGDKDLSVVANGLLQNRQGSLTDLMLLQLAQLSLVQLRFRDMNVLTDMRTIEHNISSTVSPTHLILVVVVGGGSLVDTAQTNASSHQNPLKTNYTYGSFKTKGQGWGGQGLHDPVSRGQKITVFLSRLPALVYPQRYFSSSCLVSSHNVEQGYFRVSREAERKPTRGRRLQHPFTTQRTLPILLTNQCWAS